MIKRKESLASSLKTKNQGSKLATYSGWHRQRGKQASSVE